MTEAVFNMLKPLNCLDIDHHAEETTVRVLRNSWNILMKESVERNNYTFLVLNYNP